MAWEKEWLDVVINPITKTVNKLLPLGVFPRSMKTYFLNVQ